MKLFWLFPIYKYEKWTETVNARWTPLTYTVRNRITGSTMKRNIKVYYNRAGDTVFWKHAF